MKQNDRGTKAAPTLKIREMPLDERPREKLVARGAGALNDSELIAILLRTGLPGANAVEVARKLLAQYGSLGGLSRCTVKEIAAIRGIGQAKAVLPLAWVSDWRERRLRERKSTRPN
jgi:DNA repair protein RadC